MQEEVGVEGQGGGTGVVMRKNGRRASGGGENINLDGLGVTIYETRITGLGDSLVRLARRLDCSYLDSFLIPNDRDIFSFKALKFYA